MYKTVLCLTFGGVIKSIIANNNISGSSQKSIIADNNISGDSVSELVLVVIITVLAGFSCTAIIIMVFGNIVTLVSTTLQ